MAIANELRRRQPEAEILFVGANGRMEMTRVPEAGYEIVGLDISGLQRRLTPQNLMFPLRVFRERAQGGQNHRKVSARSRGRRGRLRFGAQFCWRLLRGAFRRLFRSRTPMLAW